MNNNELVTKKLIESHQTISFMESCTSGLLASMFTDTEGASAVFKGSEVTYCNEAKISAGVENNILDKYGVYSAECAEAMAKAIQNKYHTDIAIGITGSTGNIDPNNTDSIQGDAFYCIRLSDTSYHYHIKMNVINMNRKDIKQAYADEVYKSLYELLQK